jgi:hypothetical protein
MGAFLSGENVARQQDVEANFLSQVDANRDYVRKIPYEEDKNTLRREFTQNINENISGLRGGYNDSLKQMNDDYSNRFTTLRGDLSELNNTLSGKINSDIMNLRGEYTTGNLSQLQSTLQNNFSNELSTLRGEYTTGNLSQLQSTLQNNFSNELSTLRGGYEGNLVGLESTLSKNINDNITGLRVNLSDDFNNELTTLRGAYGGNLSDLQTTLRKNFSDDLTALRGEYDGRLSTMTSENNSKYATLEQLFGEFKTTYDSDKTVIIKRADDIEDLINQEASSIKTKFDNELASFRTEYNQKLGNYALNERVEGLNKTIDAGLTPNEVLTIKAIVNSQNFESLFNDLKNRGIITTTTTPAQFLRHLRHRNYVFY